MIRLAGPADMDAMIALQHAAPEAAHWSAAEYAAILRKQDSGALRRWCYLFENEAGLFESKTGVEGKVASGSRDGGLLGFIVVKLLRVGGEAMGEIENLAVAAAARRRGVGAALCRAALGRLHDEGVATVELEVRAGNRAALALYRRLGLEATGIRLDYYSNPTEDAHLLRGRLPCAK
jgi:ribosomal protein S18 acetylase RimI-like enzyme